MYALEFLRLDGRWHQPAYYNIPADATPADELTDLLVTMRDEIGARIAEMSPGRYAMQIADQCWAVRIISIVAGKTQELAAVELDTAERSA